MKSYKNRIFLSVSFPFKFLKIKFRSKSLKRNFLIFREFSGGDFFQKIQKKYIFKKTFKKKVFFIKVKIKGDFDFLEVKNVFFKVFFTFKKIKAILGDHKLIKIVNFNCE